MKVTIDLPDEILHRAKVVAAQRRITLKELIIRGLDRVTQPETQSLGREAALARLHKGLMLGGKPLTRSQANERIGRA